MSRFLQTTILTALVASAVMPVFGSVLVKKHLEARQDSGDTVLVADKNAFCMIMPRDQDTTIDDSKRPGGMQTYCSPDGKSSNDQGLLPPNFWSNVDFLPGEGEGPYVQLTGCIQPETLDRLKPDDAGGQYDSSGGSICSGYNYYVELVEPASSRACIRCCANPNDCPTDKGSQGCPAVIPGNYFDCLTTGSSK